MTKKFKDPVSGITHLLGAVLALLGAFWLVIPAIRAGNIAHIAGFAIFGLSLLLLYSASATYHLVKAGEKASVLLRRLDHMMIYVLIAGSYTPICLIALPRSIGIPLLVGIWALALVGIVLTLFFLNAPRWLTVANYIFMGWMAIFAIVPLTRAIPAGGIFWMVLGGMMYSGGAVIYALKKPNWLPGRFGFHELWHLFVMAGSLSHFLMMAQFIQYL